MSPKWSNTFKFSNLNLGAITTGLPTSFILSLPWYFPKSKIYKCHQNKILQNFFTCVQTSFPAPCFRLPHWIGGLKILCLWLRHTISCGLAETYRSFVISSKHMASVFGRKYGGRMRLQNVGKILPGHAEPLPRRRQSSPSKHILSLERNTKISTHTRQLIKVHFRRVRKISKSDYYLRQSVRIELGSIGRFP